MGTPAPDMLKSLPALFCTLALATALPQPTAPLVLTAFDGSQHDFHWIEENDPVMGGVSTNCTFSKNSQFGVFQGEVQNVPSLKAPGFCFARTLLTFSKDFPDASAYTSLQISYQSSIPYTGFKADFNTTASDKLQTVTLPFEQFSNKWSQATGEPTAHNPPTAKNLRDISQLQIWAEGVKGPFNLKIQQIAAV